MALGRILLRNINEHWSDQGQENSETTSEPSEGVGDFPNNTDARSSLKSLRLGNVGKVIIGYLNINSLKNKFEALKEITLKCDTKGNISKKIQA